MSALHRQAITRQALMAARTGKAQDEASTSTESQEESEERFNMVMDIEDAFLRESLMDSKRLVKINPRFKLCSSKVERSIEANDSLAMVLDDLHRNASVFNTRSSKITKCLAANYETEALCSEGGVRHTNISMRSEEAVSIFAAQLEDRLMHNRMPMTDFSVKCPPIRGYEALDVEEEKEEIVVRNGQMIGVLTFGILVLGTMVLVVHHIRSK